MTWTIGKARRELCDFTGGDIIKKQLEDPKSIPRRRIGLTFSGWVAAGNIRFILDNDGNQIGEVTSGGFSPVLQKNIAMGYVDKAFAKAGTEMVVETRGKRTPAVATKMPFINTTYYRPE